MLVPRASLIFIPGRSSWHVEYNLTSVTLVLGVNRTMDHVRSIALFSETNLTPKETLQMITIFKHRSPLNSSKHLAIPSHAYTTSRRKTSRLVQMASNQCG